VLFDGNVVVKRTGALGLGGRVILATGAIGAGVVGVVFGCCHVVGKEELRQVHVARSSRDIHPFLSGIDQVAEAAALANTVPATRAHGYSDDLFRRWRCRETLQWQSVAAGLEGGGAAGDNGLKVKIHERNESQQKTDATRKRTREPTGGGDIKE